MNHEVIIEQGFKSLLDLLEAFLLSSPLTEKLDIDESNMRIKYFNAARAAINNQAIPHLGKFSDRFAYAVNEQGYLFGKSLRDNKPNISVERLLITKPKVGEVEVWQVRLRKGHLDVSLNRTFEHQDAACQFGKFVRSQL